MKRVLITGMSGTGKSSLLDELAARGYRTVDTDYGGYFQVIGGESLWRAQWSERADPFADVGRGTGRGPGWQRAAGTLGSKPGGEWTSRTFTREPARVIEARASAVSFGNKGRDDLAVGMRVFHQKFGYGEIAGIEGNKLEIDFEQAGRKRVMDSFVSVE